MAGGQLPPFPLNFSPWGNFFSSEDFLQKYKIWSWKSPIRGGGIYGQIEILSTHISVVRNYAQLSLGKLFFFTYDAANLVIYDMFSNRSIQQIDKLKI